MATFQSTFGLEKGSKFVDPLFVNASGADFHLLSASPAKDAGAALTSVPTDLSGTLQPQGVAYDMGAYEFITTPKPALPAPRNLKVQ